MSLFKRIDHIELIPKDAEAALGFYTKVLGFRITQRIPVPAPPLREVIYLKLGDTVLEIMAVDGAKAAPANPWGVGYRAIALEVEDMAAAVAHLAANGITLPRPPVDLGDSIRGEFQDPDGLAIELRQWKKPVR